jgi:hypothetical protein
VTGTVSGWELLAFTLWFAASMALLGHVAAHFARWRKASASVPPPPVNRKRNKE